MAARGDGFGERVDPEFAPVKGGGRRAALHGSTGRQRRSPPGRDGAAGNQELPGPGGWSRPAGPEAERARQEIDYGRRGVAGYVFGALQPARGAALTLTYERRTTANLVDFLGRVDAWVDPSGRAHLRRARQPERPQRARRAAVRPAAPALGVRLPAQVRRLPEPDRAFWSRRSRPRAAGYSPSLTRGGSDRGEVRRAGASAAGPRASAAVAAGGNSTVSLGVGGRCPPSGACPPRPAPRASRGWSHSSFTHQARRNLPASLSGRQYRPAQAGLDPSRPVPTGVSLTAAVRRPRVRVERRLARRPQAGRRGDQHRFGQGSGTQPLHQLGAVDLDRARADPEVPRNRLVGAAGQQPLQTSRSRAGIPATRARASVAAGHRSVRLGADAGQRRRDRRQQCLARKASRESPRPRLHRPHRRPRPSPASPDHYHRQARLAAPSARAGSRGSPASGRPDVEQDAAGSQGRRHLEEGPHGRERLHLVAGA